jgi:hypothetical protein
MPWLVVLFGIMIAPLGVVSISFIIIQPIVIGTWSTLTLIAAAAMLIQIPYSLDELLASLQFVRRRANAGRNWLTVFLRGDADDGEPIAGQADELDARPGEVVREMLAGGVNLPWNLALAALVGGALMGTRLLFGTDGAMAHADHLVGALVLTIVSISAAEVARPVRLLLIPLGLTLLVTPWVFAATTAATGFSLAAGAALIALSLRRGAVRQHYGTWDARIR